MRTDRGGGAGLGGAGGARASSDAWVASGRARRPRWPWSPTRGGRAPGRRRRGSCLTNRAVGRRRRPVDYPARGRPRRRWPTRPVCCGGPASRRRADAFDESRFPDDPYGLTPASLGAVDAVPDRPGPGLGGGEGHGPQGPPRCPGADFWRRPRMFTESSPSDNHPGRYAFTPDPLASGLRRRSADAWTPRRDGGRSSVTGVPWSSFRSATASHIEQGGCFAVVAGGKCASDCRPAARRPARPRRRRSAKATGPRPIPTRTADLHAPAGSLTGAGSTFDQPFFTKAFYVYNQQNSGVTVNYASIGSGGGIQQFQANTVNFGASDVPMSPLDISGGHRRPGPPGAGGPGRRSDLLQPSRCRIGAQAHSEGAG